MWTTEKEWEKEIAGWWADRTGLGTHARIFLSWFMMNEDRVFFRYFSLEFDGGGAMGVYIWYDTCPNKWSDT